MKGLIVLLSTIMIMSTLIQESMALQIVKPASGSVFHSGDRVAVEVSIEQSEQLIGVWFFTLNIKETGFDFTEPYTFEFTIPLEYTGSETIVVNGKLQDDSHVESRVKVNVLLPDNISLEKITVEPKRLYLRKVPEGTQGADAFEKRQIDVYGLFSDGVTRSISSSSSGTEYSSRNENIATVNSDGLVSAVSVGNTEIIVKNGKKQEVVTVKVNLKK